MKISQSAFIQDCVIKEKLTKCNANVIPIKIGTTIEIMGPKNYKKTNLHIYRQLISKLNIPFVVKQLSKHNTNQRKSYLQAAEKLIQYFCGTI